MQRHHVAMWRQRLQCLPDVYLICPSQHQPDASPIGLDVERSHRSRLRRFFDGSREAGEGIEFVTGDLATGEGIDSAVEGVEIIVHCAASSTGDEEKALYLVRAASRAGGECGTWCTSRSSAPTGSPSSAALIAPCSATSPPSWPPSVW